MAVAAKALRRVAPAVYVRSGSFWVQCYRDGVKEWHGPNCDKCSHEPIVDLASAKRVKRALEAEKHLPKVFVMDTETVSEWAERWLTVFPRARQSTNVHNAERIRGFVKAFGHLPLDKVTREQARTFANEFPGAVKEVRAMFSDAQRVDLVDSNPFSGLNLPASRGRRDIVAPTEAQITALAAKAGEVWGDWGKTIYGPMIVFAAFTGLRPGELHALTWEDIGDSIRVNKAVGKDGTVGLTKSGRARSVPLLPSAADALPPRGEGIVFLTPRGKRFSARTSSYYWKGLDAGFDFYALRHSAATRLAEAGVSPLDIAEFMGHADGGALAMRLYCHITEDGAQRRILRAFEDCPEP